MTEFRDRARQIAQTAQKLASLRGAVEEAEVLAVSSAQLIETGYDNWNGGITFFTLTLEVPLERYAALEPRRSELEASILKRVKDLTRTESGLDITEVVISPRLDDAEPPAEGVATEGPAERTPDFWRPGHFRLFISHSSKIKPIAHGLKAALIQFQIAAFVAHDDIEPTREWEAEIESALRTMDALVAILTPDFLPSKWCDQEVGIAIGRGKLVVPVRAGADPHGFLGKYQGIKSNEPIDVPSLATSIVQALCRNARSFARMADSLVESMATACTFDSAKKTIAILEEIPRLNSLQSARLLAAIDDNDQVQKAFGVPARIKALVGRVGQGDAS